LTGCQEMLRFFMDQRDLEKFLKKKLDDLEEGFD